MAVGYPPSRTSSTPTARPRRSFSTTLHAGGKFGGGGYKMSGGLHGVGVSVVNALSSRLVLEIDREGSHHVIEFRNGGERVAPLSITGPAPHGRTGTTVSFWPDPARFEETEFRAQTVVERLQVMAFLNKGLEINFEDQRPERAQKVGFRYTGGIVDYVKHLNSTKEPLFRKVCSFSQAEEDQQVEIALQWNTAFHESIYSFANGISTVEGGMHEEGFKKALTNVVNRYVCAKGHLKEKDDNLQGEDIREGLTAIISVLLRDPQFEGQTKAKLGNVSTRSLVERATNEKLAAWLEENPRSEPDRAEGGDRGPSTGSGTPGEGSHTTQVSPRWRRPSRKARRLPVARSKGQRAFHRRGKFRPGARPSRRVTLRPRRSCRYEERS